MERRVRVVFGHFGLICVIAMLILTACDTTNSSNSSASASSGQSTLDKVLSSKVLRVGVILGAPPFGQMDANNNFVGYDPDVVGLLASDLKATVKMTVLPTSPARITALAAGDVDIVAADFTMTPVRAETVSFTVPYAQESVVLVGHQGDGIRTYADLAGRKVGIVTGTTQEILTQLAPKAVFVRFTTDPAMRQAFISGQIEAHLGDSGVAAAEVKASPDQHFEIKQTIQQDMISLGVRRGDIEWLNWVNGALTYHGLHGDLQALYLKWFNEPMPKVLPSF